jgi:NAD(P)H-hydrate epimerase
MADSNCKLYTAAQVRGIDSAAIDGLGIPGYELMSRAGRAIVDTALEQFPQARRWLVLCGPGNNGGDGYVAARLAQDAGVEIRVCSMVDPALLKGDAQKAYDDWIAKGGQVMQWPLNQDIPCDLALDALLGTGIDREVGGAYRHAIAYLNDLECPKLAIDIPSGLNADTGRVMGCAVRAAATVTFVGRKRGMYTLDGPDHCGPVVFDDLAVPPEAPAGFADEAGELLSKATLAALLPPRLRNTHKGTFGHLLAVGGIAGMSGAVRLCGEAALRSGAGLVTLATDPAHAGVINLARPELMVRAIANAGDLLPLLGGEHVLALGPGLGASDWSHDLLDACLGAGAPMVVDADGLNLLAEKAGQGGFRRDDWILTPHPAEAARLLGGNVAEVQSDRVAAAQALAGGYGAVVVLKGCGSVVAAPGGAYAICPLGNPGMATAGSGDVLTGIVGALLCQGLTCHDAALAGVLAHAWAGDLAAANVGEVGMIAGDITANLPAVWEAATP